MALQEIVEINRDVADGPAESDERRSSRALTPGAESGGLQAESSGCGSLVQGGLVAADGTSQWRWHVEAMITSPASHVSRRSDSVDR
jgi:hypothetical protein